MEPEAPAVGWDVVHRPHLLEIKKKKKKKKKKYSYYILRCVYKKSKDRTQVGDIWKHQQIKIKYIICASNSFSEFPSPV